MSKRQRLNYCEAFDRLMREQFDEDFSTEWSLFAGPCGGYVTSRGNGKKLTKQMALYGRGISNGMAEGLGKTA